LLTSQDQTAIHCFDSQEIAFYAKHYNSQKHTDDSKQIWHSDKDHQVQFGGGPKHSYNKSKMAEGCHFKNKQITILPHQLYCNPILQMHSTLDTISS